MNDGVPDEAVFPTSVARAIAADARHLSTRELVSEITGKVSLLVRKEVELAKTEAKANLEAQLAMVKAMAAAALLALLGLNALLVAVIAGLATTMPAWLAAIVVGGVLVIVAAALGYLGWSWRVTAPLAVTRKTMKEDVQWAKERLA